MSTNYAQKSLDEGIKARLPTKNRTKHVNKCEYLEVWKCDAYEGFELNGLLRCRKFWWSIGWGNICSNMTPSFSYNCECLVKLEIMSTIRVETVNGWNEIWLHIQCPQQKKGSTKTRNMEPGFFEPRNGAYDLAHGISIFWSIVISGNNLWWKKTKRKASQSKEHKFSKWPSSSGIFPENFLLHVSGKYIILLVNIYNESPKVALICAL